jgi:hypothetical protein
MHLDSPGAAFHIVKELLAREDPPSHDRWRDSAFGRGQYQSWLEWLVGQLDCMSRRRSILFRRGGIWLLTAFLRGPFMAMKVLRRARFDASELVLGVAQLQIVLPCLQKVNLPKVLLELSPELRAAAFKPEGAGFMGRRNQWMQVLVEDVGESYWRSLHRGCPALTKVPLVSRLSARSSCCQTLLGLSFLLWNQVELHCLQQSSCLAVRSCWWMSATLKSFRVRLPCAGGGLVH